MRFGLFFEIQNPKPWTEDSERRVFEEAIEQAVLADELGFDIIWSAEHHFLEEYSHNPAPEIFLAAVAAKTKNIRIGHGIKHLTTNHPIRVAEQAATLDIISGGRLELGLGEGSNTTELHPFGFKFRDKRDIWLDAVKCFLPMFWNDNWSYDGPHFQVPPRNVLPKPVQKPHPPLWVACSQAKTIAQAGRWGMHAMGFAFVDPNAAEAWVNTYYNEFLNNPERLADYVPNPGVTCSYYFSCAPTDEEAMARADGATFFEFSLGHYQKHGPFEPGTTNFWGDYLEWKKTDKAREKEAFLRENMLIGSPETLRKRLQAMHALHLDQALLIAQTGKARHEDICASLELFAKEVMPEFQALEAEHQDWKQKVLNREIVLEPTDVEGLDFRPADQVTVDQSIQREDNTFAKNL